MTRYARAGKGTHQRVAKEATSWNELKHPPPQRTRSGSANNNASADVGGRPFKGNSKKERFSKQGSSDSNPPVNGDSSLGVKSKGKNSNIRGFGQSKSVKVFGQFWVPLDDAKRLKTLLKKLKAQGLPRKEILESLKNERRRAEKASKRQRDKTCFQCRQFGHILSDCPNLKKAVAKPGLEINEEDLDEEEQGLVCFKCGSTEHTSRKCRRKGENFEFAKCFVCSGSGHIARQCPQNSKGIYPSGGSCSECGSLTHLKKDCPDLVGVEMDNSSKDDPDTVMLSVSDPFASTEYEPVMDDTKSGEEEDDADAVNSACRNMKETVPIASKNKQKKKCKGKRPIDDADTAIPFEFDVDSRPTPKKPLFSSDPKKRKIVKF